MDIEEALRNHPTFDPSVEVHIKCSNCQTPLYDVISKNKYAKKKTKIIAKCWKCGDTSFEQTFDGDFYIGIPWTEETAHGEHEFQDEVFDKHGKLISSTIIIPTQKKD